MIRIALTVKPDQITLVPERREELTTEGGLDVVLNSTQLKPVVKTLQEGSVCVSMFVDPDLEQVKESHRIDARAVEINTAAYCDARDERSREAALRKVVDAARLGKKLGLAVHAGHGLTYANVGAVAAVPEITELNIGHNIVARAALVGMERAVREMVDSIRNVRH
jgi:pyridoxine 5-phosphate synthase